MEGHVCGVLMSHVGNHYEFCRGQHPVINISNIYASAILDELVKRHRKSALILLKDIKYNIRLTSKFHAVT